MTQNDIKLLPHRRYATRGDEELNFNGSIRGHDPSPEAIDGYYGIAWDQVFKDAQTGEVYVVSCYDGTNRSKGAYEDD